MASSSLRSLGSSTASPSQARRGFALLITITLLAFLVLLLVSLSSLTRVETQVAGNAQQMQEARANALLALNIALGEVQRTTGPDRRATVPADIGAPTALGNTTIASPRWVGVYGNTKAADYTQTAKTLTPSSPQLLQWLVSGNEGQVITTDGNGTITSPVPTFAGPTNAKPSDTVAVAGGGSLASATAGSNLTIGSDSAALLVGPGSVNSANATTDYVAAPLVPITAAPGSVPGLGSTATPVIGAYAWWAGDDSTKAKVNLVNSYLSQTAATDQTAYQQYSFITAQRSGIDRMDYDNAGNATMPNDVLGAAYPAMPQSAILANVLALNQLSNLGNTTTAQGQLATALPLRFHDMTAYGYGVLADPYAGGLKKDLTADIAYAADSANSASTGDRPADASYIFPQVKPADHVPTWGMLRAFPMLHPDGTGAITATPPVLNSNGDYTSPGVSPVVCFASLGLNFYLDASENIQVAMFPVVILWNPYSATLNASSYEVGFHVSQLSNSHSPPRYYIETSPTGSSPTVAATLDLGAGTLTAGSSVGGGSGFIRFAIQGVSMAPGEAQVYALHSTGAPYVPGSTSSNVLMPTAGGVYNYASWSIPDLALSATTYNDGNGTMDVRTALTSQAGQQAFDVVLAPPGALASWGGTDIGSTASTSNWYQAILDANLGGRAATSSSWIYPSPSKLFSNVPTTSLPPSTAMFATIAMEGRGSFNASSSFDGGLGTGGGQGGRFRWLITGNPHAQVVRNTGVENTSFPRGNVVFGSLLNFTEEATSSSTSAGTTATNVSGRDIVFPYYTGSSGGGAGYNTGIGGSEDWGNGAPRGVLFDVLQSSNLFLSLGQLQHAALGTYGFYPTYPFGNSWADVRIDGIHTYYPSAFSPTFTSPSISVAAASTQTLYDLSWWLNRSLWDKYFVSGVPSTWAATDVEAGRVLPNARITYHSSTGGPPAINDLRYASGNGAEAYDNAAGNLLVNGAFNVNSTSVQAWRALLGSTLGLPDNALYATPGGAVSASDPGDGIGSVAAIPRFSSNQAQTGYTDTMTNGNNSYLGNRGLLTGSTSTVTQLVDELARSIVAQVKARGPFLSVADFVNRRLVSNLAPDPALGICGTLQAAINNMGTTAAGSATATGVQISQPSSAPLGSGDNPVTSSSLLGGSGWITNYFLGGPSSDTASSAASTGQNSTRSVNAPKFLSQADLLSLIGPALTVRGDSFVIRTYGEVKNPATGVVVARAWCEAHIQRVPDYVDNTIPADTALSSAGTTNQTFGRRYKVVSFRWLSPSDI